MSFSSLDSITNLDEMIFIGGNQTTIEFQVIDGETGTPLDLGSSLITWNLCPYGQSDYVVVTKSGTIDSVDPSIFSVVVESDDTKDLSGKFFHQFVIQDVTGAEFIPCQGIITIIPLIQ